MKQLPKKFERFCYRNRNRGIPNLMLWIIIANVVVYMINYMDPSGALSSVLAFDKDAILRGEVWRCISFILLELSSRRMIWAAIAAIFYYQLGLALENTWGRCKFSLYYLTGIVFLNAAGFIFDIRINSSALNMTLFLAYATLYPETYFRVFFIIPVKARWLGIIDLAIYLYQLLQIHAFPYNLLPLFALANYFLYLGKDFFNIFPDSWRINARRLFKRSPKTAKTIPFPKAGSYDASHTTVRAPYTHKCTVCGRTDISDPGLEFRYCSRCKGYYCYCVDHISNHAHIE